MHAGSDRQQPVQARCSMTLRIASELMTMRVAADEDDKSSHDVHVLGACQAMYISTAELYSLPLGRDLALPSARAIALRNRRA